MFVGRRWHVPSPYRTILEANVLTGETNKHRYVIATQSAPLRNKLRGIPAVPVVHMNRSVMILEPPSDATLDAKEAVRVYLALITSPYNISSN